MVINVRLTSGLFSGLTESQSGVDLEFDYDRTLKYNE